MPRAPASYICSASANGDCPNPDAGVLALHNQKRALHTGTSALTWSATVAASAQAWADGCIYQHTTGGSYGENLYATTGSGGADACSSATDSWCVRERCGACAGRAWLPCCREPPCK